MLPARARIPTDIGKIFLISVEIAIRQREILERCEA